MANQDGLFVCLNRLFEEVGPPLEKTAEALFMDRLTREGEDLETFGPEFVKLSELQGLHPWDHAYRVAFFYPELEKAAEAGFPLSQYYVQWADDLVKTAFLGKALQWGKNLVTRGARKAPGALHAPGGQQMASAGEQATAAKNWQSFFGKAQAPKPTPPPGASVDVAAVNKAKGFRSIKDIKKAPKAPTGQAPAAGAGGAGGAGAGGAEAGKQGINWGNVGYGAAGTAILGGTGYLAHKGYQAVKRRNQPQAAYYGGGRY